jgi:hypothetical protein
MSPAEYYARAIEHRPQTLQALRETAQRMLAEGYTDHGIASALQVAVEQVRRLIGCSDCQ